MMVTNSRGESAEKIRTAGSNAATVALGVDVTEATEVTEVTEAFDEPLTMAQVLAIVGPFLA